MASKSVYNTNLISDIKDIKKAAYEIKNDYIILNLNSNNFSSKELIEETIYTFNLSIKENYNINKVVYYIDDNLYNSYDI